MWSSKRASSECNQNKASIIKASLKSVNFTIFPWATLRQSPRNLNFQFPWQPLSEKGNALFCESLSQV